MSLNKAVNTKEGQLHKYKNVWLGWGRRYFKLERSYLHYFETKHSPEPVSTVTRGHISDVKVCHQFPGKSNVFEVHSKSGTIWYLQASSTDEMHSWMSALYPDGQFTSPTQTAVSEPLASQTTSEPLIPAPYAPGQGPYDGPFPHLYPNLYASSSPPYAPQVQVTGHSPPPSYEESAQAPPLPNKAGQ